MRREMRSSEASMEEPLVSSRSDKNGTNAKQTRVTNLCRRTTCTVGELKKRNVVAFVVDDVRC